jgi:hypothetical protein
MTYQEWMVQAEDYDQKAHEAYDRGDEIAGEMYENKANACRYNACDAQNAAMSAAHEKMNQEAMK